MAEKRPGARGTAKGTAKGPAKPQPKAQPKPKVDLAAELARQAEEFGLTGNDPTKIYGPNGQDVAAVLDELDEIDADTAETLAEAWMETDPAARDVLERALDRNFRRGRFRYELAAAEDSVDTWLSGRMDDAPDDADLWRAVADAARGAVDALILNDVLDDEDYDTLYGAWGATMDSEEEAEEEEAEEGEYGPNSELVADLLGRLADLSANQARKLTKAWKSISSGELRQAHKAAQSLADEDPTWRKQIRAAQNRVSAWPQDLPAAVSPTSARGSELIAIREAALPAAVDAVTALVLADLMDPEDVETLYSAWEDVVGEPALPEFESDESDEEPEEDDGSD